MNEFILERPIFAPPETPTIVSIPNRAEAKPQPTAKGFHTRLTLSVKPPG